MSSGEEDDEEIERQIGYHQPDEWYDFLNEPPLSPSLIRGEEQKQTPETPPTQDPDAPPPTEEEDEEEEKEEFWGVETPPTEEENQQIETPPTEDEFPELEYGQPRSPD
jgi:hypothetical protein